MKNATKPVTIIILILAITTTGHFQPATAQQTDDGKGIILLGQSRWQRQSPPIAAPEVGKPTRCGTVPQDPLYEIIVVRTSGLHHIVSSFVVTF
ncbi:MAG: hypothetical protein C4527_03625 [Candidatus Omnitrophota bacterium]|nr:MAG: hypothetical protein C4527_03625 [Candidatus Omnitrophota bacterium]